MKLFLDQTYIYAGKFYGPGEVDITDEAAAQSIASKLPNAPEPAPEASAPPVEPIGIPADVTEKLIAAGYATPEQIAAASDDELLAIEGIGPATLKKIRAA